MAIIQKNNARLQFDTVAELQATSKRIYKEDQIIYLKGILSGSDDGHGDFRYDASSSATDDGATVIDPVGGGNGRLLRVFGQTVSVKDFGATGDGVTDDSAAIQAAIDTGTSLNFPDGTYLASALTVSTNYQSFMFSGLAVIKKNANGPIVTVSGDRTQWYAARFDGDGSTYTGSNIVKTGNHMSLINCSSRDAADRALIDSDGDGLRITGTNDIYQTSQTDSTPVSVSGITRSGTTATATQASVAYSNGDRVTVKGAAQTDYNGIFTISNVTATTFDYTVANSPATPATGTITSLTEGYDIEIGGGGFYSKLTDIYTGQSTGGILLNGTGSAGTHSIVGGQFGKLTMKGSGSTNYVTNCRINGKTLIERGQVHLDLCSCSSDVTIGDGLSAATQITVGPGFSIISGGTFTLNALVTDSVFNIASLVGNGVTVDLTNASVDNFIETDRIAYTPAWTDAGGGVNEIAVPNGTDDTSSSATFLTDSTQSWQTNVYNGNTLTNLTTGASELITSNTGTTITTTPDITWNSGDEYSMSGAGVLTGFYTRRGKMVIADIYLAIGSSTTFGSGGAWEFTVPIANAAALRANGSVVMKDQTGNFYSASADLPVSVSEMQIRIDGGGTVTLSAPFTWAVGDYLKLQVEYYVD